MSSSKTREISSDRRRPSGFRSLPDVHPTADAIKIKEELERAFWLERHPGLELDSGRLLEEVQNDARSSPTSQNLSMLIHLKDLRRFREGEDHVVHPGLYGNPSPTSGGISRSVQQQPRSRSIDSPEKTCPKTRTVVSQSSSAPEKVRWPKVNRTTRFTFLVAFLAVAVLLVVFLFPFDIHLPS